MKLTIKELNKLLVFHKRCAEEPSSNFIETTDLEPFNPPSIEVLIHQILKDQEALREAREYFDDLYDADCDQDGFIPNKEMTLLVEIEAALLPKE